MNSKGNQIKNLCVSGFAMFAIFFGAGNLIFPPALGIMTGKAWFIAFLGYFVMDVVLALLGVFVIIKYDGELMRVPERLGNKVGKVGLIVLVICLGPLVSIPRTATVTFSMSVKPIMGMLEDAPIPLAIFTLVFFAIVLLFSLRPGKVVDIVGKYMTPVLLILLLVTIIAGVIKATASPGEILVESPIKAGVINGYQTCDGLGSIIFAGVLVKAARSKCPDSPRIADREIYGAGVLAGILLFIVYLGLCFLGMSWGQPYAEYFMGGIIDQAGLLDIVVGSILGWTGVYMIAAITLFACLTTAIGLTTACAENLEVLFGNKLSYKKIVIGIAIISLILANIGLKQILMFANPILNIMYPPIITLIILGLLSDRIKGRLPFILGTATALACGLMLILRDTIGIVAFGFIHKLPLDAWNLGFVIPTLIAVIVGVIIGSVRAKATIEG